MNNFVKPRSRATFKITMAITYSFFITQFFASEVQAAPPATTHQLCSYIGGELNPHNGNEYCVVETLRHVITSKFFREFELASSRTTGKVYIRKLDAYACFEPFAEGGSIGGYSDFPLADTPKIYECIAQKTYILGDRHPEEHQICMNLPAENADSYGRPALEELSAYDSFVEEDSIAVCSFSQSPFADLRKTVALEACVNKLGFKHDALHVPIKNLKAFHACYLTEIGE